MTATPQRVEGSDVVVMQAPTLYWALKRTLLGIVILIVTVAAAASLLYASIEPDEAISASSITPSPETAAPVAMQRTGTATRAPRG